MNVLPIQKVAIINFFKKRDAKDIFFLSSLAGAEVWEWVRWRMKAGPARAGAWRH